jgi:hypothetical protein
MQSTNAQASDHHIQYPIHMSLPSCAAVAAFATHCDLYSCVYIGKLMSQWIAGPGRQGRICQHSRRIKPLDIDTRFTNADTSSKTSSAH